MSACQPFGGERRRQPGIRLACGELVWPETGRAQTRLARGSSNGLDVEANASRPPGRTR